jgi:hypothetical protein
MKLTMEYALQKRMLQLLLIQLLYYQFATGRYVGSFDPLDIVMYSLSVGLAVVVEQKVFAKNLKFW